MNSSILEEFIRTSKIHLNYKEKPLSHTLNIGTLCQGFHQETNPHHCRLYNHNPELNCKYLETNGNHKEGYCTYKIKNNK